MEIAQIIIAICMVFITATIMVIAFFLIMLIKQLQKLAAKTEGVVDNISRPVNSMVDFFMGFRNSFPFFKKFKQ